MTGNCPARRPLLAALITLGLVTGCVSSETANVGEERWTCCAHQVGVYCPNAVDVALSANRAKGTGMIRFGDIVESTNFKIEGFSRRWNWKLNPRLGYDYAFIIRPNLLGFYFDFTDLKAGETRGESKTAYTCKRR